MAAKADAWLSDRVRTTVIHPDECSVAQHVSYFNLQEQFSLATAAICKSLTINEVAEFCHLDNDGLAMHTARLIGTTSMHLYSCHFLLSKVFGQSVKLRELSEPLCIGLTHA